MKSKRSTLTRIEVVDWVSRIDQDEQTEMLTLLSHAGTGGDTDYGFAWMASEPWALQEAYSLVAKASNAVVVTLPDWFSGPVACRLATSVDGDMVKLGGDDEEVMVLPLSSLPPLGCAADGFLEESTIRQASVWAGLTHPCIARLCGACHVGDSRLFAIHARLEPFVRIERSTQGDDDDMKDFVLSKFCEASATLDFLHERGLAYSVGSGDTSRLNSIRVYCSPESNTVQLLGVGLLDLTLLEFLSTTRSQDTGTVQQDAERQSHLDPRSEAERAQADDVCRLGMWMADLITDSKSALQQSAKLWELIDAMCRPNRSERTPAYYATRRLEIMHRHRDRGADRVAELRRVFGDPMLSPGVASSAVEEMLAGIVRMSGDTFVTSCILDAFRLLHHSDRQLPALALNEFCFLCADVLSTLRQLNGRDAFTDTKVAEADNSTEHQDGGTVESVPLWARSALYSLGRLLLRLELPVDFGGHQWPTAELGSTTRSLPWLISPDVAFSRDMLGLGGFGNVHRGEWNGVSVAIERLLSDNMWSPGGSLASYLGSSNDSLELTTSTRRWEDSPCRRTSAVAAQVAAKSVALREAGLRYQLDHINIVRMFGACIDVSPPFIVCELASGGNLRGMQRRHHAPYEIWIRLLEAARGIQYLHRKGIVHGDLKGNNIVIGADGVAKLIDFSASFFAKEGQPEELRGVGPVYWTAPECLRFGGKPSTEASFASDIYSFGMCIIEVVSGELPWTPLPSEVVRYYVTSRNLPVRPREMSDNEWRLIERMRCFDPADRLSIDYVVVYLAQLVERLDSPWRIAHTPSSLPHATSAVSDLVALARYDIALAGNNDLLNPDAFFVTSQALRRLQPKWTSNQVRDLLSLLDRDGLANRNVWVTRVLGQLSPDALARAGLIIASDTTVIALLITLIQSHSAELQLSGAAALRRLSTECEPVKRSIGKCGGIGTLLALARSSVRSLEVRVMVVTTLCNVSTMRAELIGKRQSSIAPQEGWTMESFCWTLIVVNYAASGDSELCASIRANALGALRNVVFKSRDGASSVMRVGRMLVLLRMLESGTNAEKTEAAGALWNVVTSSDSMGEDQAAVTSALVQLLMHEEGKAESSSTLQAQVVGAIHALLTKTQDTAATIAQVQYNNDLDVEGLAAALQRIAAARSKGTAVRTLASEAAHRLLGF